MEKTKAQLIDELEGMRERVAVLEAQEADHKRIKASLRYSEERYRTLFAEAPASVTIIDTSGIVVDCNEATAALTGFSKGEIAGKRFDELMTLDPKDLPKLMESHERNIRGEDIEPFDLEIIGKDGSRRWILVKVSLFKRRGKVTGIQIYAIDITERRQAQAELRIKDDAIASSINAVALSDLDGKLTYVNSSFLEMWGYESQDEVLGRSAMELWKRSQQSSAVWEAALKKGGARGELEAVRKDGSTFTAELSISLVTDAGGAPLCVMGSFLDITERRHAEGERDELLRQLNSRVRDLNCLYGISSVLARQDISPEERFRGILELIPPAWQHPNITCARITIGGKRYKTRNFKKTGWVQAQDITVHGERVGTVEVCYLEERPEAAEGPFMEEERHLIEAIAGRLGEAIERKRAKEALRDSEEKYRALFNESRDGISLIDAETGSIHDCNPEFEQQSGRKLEQLKNMKIWDLRPPEKVEAAKNKFFEVSKSGEGEAAGLDFQRPDGTIVSIEFKSRAVEILGGRYLQSVTRDVTERRRDEKMLTQAKVITDNMEEALALFDMGGSVSLVNPAYEKMTGYKAKELMGKSGVELSEMTIAERELDRILQVFGRALKGAKLPPISTYLKHKDGREMPIEFRVSFVKDERGQVVQIVAVITDITERKRAEEALRESEEMRRLVLDNTDASINYFDEEGIIRLINRKSCERLGWDPKDAVGRSIYDMFPKEVADFHMQRFSQIIEEGEGRIFDDVFELPQGTSYFLSDIQPMRDVSGKVVGVQIIATDITDRKRAEEARLESEEKLRIMFSSITDGIVLTDMEANITKVNDSMLRMGKYKNEKELVGRNALDFVSPKDRAKAMKNLRKEIAEGHSIKPVEYTLLASDGSGFVVESSAAVVRDNSGNPVGLVNVMRDVTERKQAEEALRLSEERYRSLVEIANECIVVVQDGIIKFANPKTEEVTGYAPDELASSSFVDYIHPDDREVVVEAHMRALKEGKAPYLEPFRMVAKNGDIKWLFRNTVSIDWEGKPATLTFLSDITERKQAEEALRESEDKYRSVVERASDLIVIVQDGEIRFVNQRGIEMLGYTPEEAVGTSTVKYIHPDAVELALNHYQRRMSGEGVETAYDSALLHKDGRRVDVEVSGGLINYQGKPADLAILRDITERKRSEEALRDSEAKLRAMFEASPDFIMDADREGKLLFINRTVPELKPDEIPGTSLYDYLAPEVRDAYKETLAQVFQSGEPASIETAGLGPSGRTSYYSTRFSPIIHGGQVDTVMIIATDVTEHKMAEEELRKSEEKLRFMFESLDDGIIVVDLEGRIVEVNEATLRLAGCKKKKDMVGWNVFDFVAEKDRARALEENAKNVMEGHGSAVEYTAVDIDGQEFDVESTGALMRDSSGNPVGFITAVRDVTERKRIEEALRASEEKLRIMFDSITDGILVTDLMGTIIDVNGAALRLHGYSDRQALVGRKGLDLILKEYQSVAIEKMLKWLREGSDATMEYVLSRPDGTEVDIQGVVNLLHDSSGNPIGLVVITRDITERKRAEENLKLYVEEVTRAQEEERKRIARDLHDETVQELAALALDIEAAKRADKRLSEDTVNALERIQEKSRSIMEGVNRFSAELRPDILDQMGLLSALSWLVEKIGADIDVRVELSGDERRLSAEVELALFRVAQEALSNVRKHSEAVKAMVKVAFTADGVWLEVRDYGKGFTLPDNIADLAVKGHLGILGMHERARIIDGTVSVRSRPDEGTSVSIVV